MATIALSLPGQERYTGDMHPISDNSSRPATRRLPVPVLVFFAPLAVLLGCATEVDYGATGSDSTAAAPAAKEGGEAPPFEPEEPAGVDSLAAAKTDTADIVNAIASPEAGAGDTRSKASEETIEDAIGDAVDAAGSGAGRYAFAPEVGTPATPGQDAPPRYPPAPEPLAGPPQPAPVADSLPEALQGDRYAPELFGGLGDPEPGSGIDNGVDSDVGAQGSGVTESKANTFASEDKTLSTTPGGSGRAAASTPNAENGQEKAAAQASAQADDDWSFADNLLGGDSLFGVQEPKAGGSDRSAANGKPEGEKSIPMASAFPPEPSSSEPIPLDPNNTRHLAWLLGAKAAVVSLAGLGGVEEARQSRWEVKALADLLGVSQPDTLGRLAADAMPEAVIAALIREARTTADQLSNQHGPDHAALLEIALKTNAMLVLYERRPALAAAVLQAVSVAGDRAGLPRDMLAPLTNTLDRRAPSEEVHRAVHRVHREVERLLREGPAAADPTAGNATRRS